MNPTSQEELWHFAATTGEQFQKNLTELLTFFRDNFGNLLWKLLGVVLILVLARVTMDWVSKLTKRTMEKNQTMLSVEQSRRVNTLMTLTRSVSRYVIYFVAFLLIINQFGSDMANKALLAVGGMGSLAFGFGAQNLVKDVVTGFFMIFENQFSVGDYIQTEEATGTVEATAMRVTYLRSPKGDQIIVPNGSINRVVNYTRGSYVAVVTIATAYEADTRKVMEVMEEALAQYGKEHLDLIEEMPVVRGIDALSPSSVDIGVACKVKPMKQWEVERGMRLAIKEAFESQGMSFPYPHVVTVAQSAKEGPTPEELERLRSWQDEGTWRDRLDFEGEL